MSTTDRRGRDGAWWLAIGAIALVALVLRLWNLDWDDRQHLHPDERHWALTSAAIDRAEAPPDHGTIVGPLLDWLDGQRSPANPYRGSDSFVYGPAPLAGSRAVAGWLRHGATTGSQPASAVVHGLDAAGIPLLDDVGAPRFDAAYQVDLVGRLLGALADTLTVVVVGLIGRRLGRRQGLVAAFLAATSVLAIQHAHFMGSEPYVGLTAALTILAALGLDRGSGRRAALRSGLLLGLATGALVAAKATGLGLALVPGLLVAALVARHRRSADVVRFVGFVAGGVVAFRTLYPAAFDGLGLGLAQQFLEDQQRTREAADADMPPAIQWAARIPVLEGLRWLVLFTVGPGTAFAAVAGSLVLLRRRAAAFGWWTATVLVAGWVVPLAFVFRDDVTSGRYFMPMLPALFVCGGHGVVQLWDAARARGAGSASNALPVTRRLRTASAVAAVAAVGLSAFWGVGFVNGVYRPHNTRIEASWWIAENVEPGSTLTSQAWDDAIPLAVDGIDTSGYVSIQLDMFGADSVEKVDTVVGQLQQADYVVETSPRVWRTVTRLPARFPSTIRFFEGLDDGSLGFERAAGFSRSIGLGPLRIPDGSAEEAFSVYDHAEVRIWRKVRDVTGPEMTAVLDPVAAATAVQVAPQVGSANGAMAHADEIATNARVGTYADDFDIDGNPWVHLLGWVVVIELLAIATFAITAPALRVLPDAGLGISKALGLVAVAFTVFAATTWGGFDLTRGLVLVAVAGWLALGAWSFRRRRSALSALWRERKRLLVQTELVTLAVLAVVLLVKAANPDLWHLYRGGEKPFELEMFTAVLRTRTLPPYDPWFAGGTLNYYYGGYLLLSVPARLMRTAPPLALTLSMAVIASLAAGAAHSAGAAIASLMPPGRRVRRAGVLAVLATLLLPNAAIVPSIIDRLRGVEKGPIDWWSLSRTIDNSPVVTEFPSWSILFGDVHPHVMDLPLVLTVLTLALAWRRLLVSESGWRPLVLVAVATGLVAGAARTVNTWDLPLLAVVAAAPAVSVLVGSGQRSARVRARCIGSAVAGASTAALAWAPYAWRTEVSDAGFELEPTHTSLANWTSHWGYLAAATVVVLLPTALRGGRRLVRSARRWIDGAPPSSSARGSLALRGGIGFAALGGLLVITVIVSAAIGAGLSACLVALTLSGASGVAALAMSRDVDVSGLVRSLRAADPAEEDTLRSADRQVDATALSRPAATALALLCLGWGYVAVIELVSVVNDFDRMNTVFKGWFGAWAVMAVALGASLARALPERLIPFRNEARDTRAPRWGVVLAVTTLVVGALVSVAFVQLAVPARLDDRTSPGGLSLDPMRYLDGDLTLTSGDPPVTYRPGDDRPLISWLRDNVAGIVTVAEAPGQGYTWTGRIASHTGLPSVIGWPYHQSQQRRAYGSEITEREVDMQNLYTSNDPLVMVSVLQRYRIAYVVFGTVETALAGADGRQALLDLPCLDVVFRDGERFVSRVDQRCLALEPGALPYSPPPR